MIPLLAHVIVRAPAFKFAALARVKHCRWRRTIYVIGLNFVAKTSMGAPDPMAPDHYEILRLNSGADNETIERVYRTLTKRFHPDNENTGEAEIFSAHRRSSSHSHRPETARAVRPQAGRFKGHSPVRSSLQGVFRGIAG
jgi:hypothetical protein